MIKHLLIALLLTLPLAVFSQQDSITIIEYNVENLFHPAHDSLKNDYEFTPEGKYRWNFTRYTRKIEQISRLITNIGGKRAPAIVGLCEVENEQCFQDLAKRMKHYYYNYVFYEGVDKRGIDVGLLYDPRQVKLVHWDHYRVFNDSINFTRDILYTTFKIIGSSDTLHLMMCHLPSQLGGTKQTEWKRLAAKNILKHIKDSIYAIQTNAKIIIMGDFNNQPKDDIEGLTNILLPLAKKGLGTHRWQGKWSCLDQVYLSPQLKDKVSVRIYDEPWLLMEDKDFMGFTPKRTFIHLRYNPKGYSDHLPLLLRYRY